MSRNFYNEKQCWLLSFTVLCLHVESQQQFLPSLPFIWPHPFSPLIFDVTAIPLSKLSTDTAEKHFTFCVLRFLLCAIVTFDLPSVLVVSSSPWRQQLRGWSTSCIARFHVLRAASIIAFWDMAPCTLVGIGRRFRGAYCLNQRVEYAARLLSETSVYLYEATEGHSHNVAHCLTSIPQRSPSAFHPEGGVGQTQAWMPTYVSLLPIPQMIWVWRATVEWYWQMKTEELGEKPAPVPLCPPQIPGREPGPPWWEAFD
jgi:hypothetical protein